MTTAPQAVREDITALDALLAKGCECGRCKQDLCCCGTMDEARTTIRSILSDLEAKDRKIAELVGLLESVRPHLTGLPDPEDIEMFLNRIDAKLEELDHG